MNGSHGDARLVTFEAARAFLDACETSRTRILGIDRVIVLERGVLPDIEGLLDLTAGGAVVAPEQALEVSRRFLCRYGKDSRERFIFTVDG